MNDRCLLVTGGAGFIGGRLVHRLLDDPSLERLVNVDRLTYAGNVDSIAGPLADPRHEFVIADVCDGPMMARLFEERRPRAVIHLAAESHVDRSIDGPAEFVRTNVVGACALLDAARGHWSSLPTDQRDRFRFLHVSTDEVYGSLGKTGAFVETTRYAPNSPYAASKASADHFVRAYHATYGLPTIVTNCSNNYGPCQFPEKLIPLTILNALDGKRLPVYGDGGNVRDWLHVDDHCRALRLVLDQGVPGETYNVGGGSERTNLEVVRAICRLVDELRPDPAGRSRESLIEFVADRPGHDRRYAIDATKVERELGWRPLMTFEQGLAETVRWYLENSGWTERVLSGKYRRERLGLGTIGS